jgi:ADP-ribosylglycohydrolase
MWAAKLGYDTDTNCAVTGMLVGSWNGIDDIPKHLIDNLQQKDILFKMAEEMYEIGARG